MTKLSLALVNNKTQEQLIEDFPDITFYDVDEGSPVYAVVFTPIENKVEAIDKFHYDCLLADYFELVLYDDFKKLYRSHL